MWGALVGNSVGYAIGAAAESGDVAKDDGTGWLVGSVHGAVVGGWCASRWQVWDVLGCWWDDIERHGGDHLANSLHLLDVVTTCRLDWSAPDVLA